MWRLMFKNKLIFAITIFFLVLRSIFEVGLAILLKNLIEVAMGHSFRKMIDLMIIAILYICIASLINYCAAKSRRVLIKRCISYIRKRGFESIMNRETGRFYSSSRSYYINIFTKGMDILENSYFHVILDMLVGLTQFITAGILISLISPILGAFILTMSLIQLAIPMFSGKWIDGLNNQYMKEHNKFIGELNEQLGAFHIVKRFKLLGIMIGKYQMKSSEDLEKRYKLDLSKYLLNELSFLLGQIMFVGTYCIGGVLAMNRIISVADIVAASQLMTYVAFPLMRSSNYLVEIKSCKELRDEIHEILDTNFPDEGEFLNNDKSKIDEWDKITIKGLSFSYNSDTPVIKNLNCEFEKGKKYVIVGKSGSGKSTFLKIIAKMYMGYTGECLIGNNELSNINEKDYYDILSMVDQETYIFDATLKENVTLFSKDFSNEDVINALTEAGMSEFLKKIDYNLLLPLGEQGNSLSGGEKQRVSIARVFLRNPQIILFDEGTSNLDNETAGEVEEVLMNKDNCTVIAVMHRLNYHTMQMVDEILVMDNGEIIERGTYDELYNRKGFFYTLTMEGEEVL